MTDVTFTYGFTEFEFDSDPSGFRNTEAQFDDQNFDPNSRAIFQIRHAWEDYAFLLRTSYWGRIGKLSERVISKTSIRLA
jgi:hypothetical protein